MKNQILFVGIVAALFVCGCVQSLDPLNYSEVKSKITISKNEHRGLVNVKAPIVGGGFDSQYYLLRSHRNIGGYFEDNSNIQIYVRSSFNEWAFLNRAYSKGKRLNITLIDREVGSCSEYGCIIYEDVAINLTLGEIKKVVLLEPSFKFELSGKSGSRRVEVPKAYFQAFVDYLEDDNANRP